MRPHRWQPMKLPLPWDSPGKNTGVGCHFLLQCRKVKSKSGVAQSCPTPSDPMDCSLPGSSVHGICQARLPLALFNSHHLLLGHKSLPKVRISNNFIQKNEILRCFVTCFDHKLRGLLANVSYIPSSNPQGSSPEPLRPQCTLFSLITIHFSDCHQKNCIKYL